MNRFAIMVTATYIGWAILLTCLAVAGIREAVHDCRWGRSIRTHTRQERRAILRRARAEIAANERTGS